MYRVSIVAYSIWEAVFDLGLLVIELLGLRRLELVDEHDLVLLCLLILLGIV